MSVLASSSFSDNCVDFCTGPKNLGIIFLLLGLDNEGVVCVIFAVLQAIIGVLDIGSSGASIISRLLSGLFVGVWGWCCSIF